MAIDKHAEREEKLHALQERLTASVETLVTGDDWRQALEFAARFRDRSFNNTLLIWVQHQAAHEAGRVPSPTPTYVAGFQQWKQLERNVIKGQQGYQIFAPVTGRFAADPSGTEAWRRLGRGEKPNNGEAVRSKVVGWRHSYVWDVSQTDGKPVPEVSSPQLLQGEAPVGLRLALIAAIERQGFTVQEVADAAEIRGANGMTDFGSNVVSVRTDMDAAAQVKTLAHELGHVSMHHPDDQDWTRHTGIGEVEAESFALMVGAAHGMDTSNYTIPYVARWAAAVPGKEPVAVVQATANKVCKAASKALVEMPTVQVPISRPPEEVPSVTATPQAAGTPVATSSNERVAQGQRQAQKIPAPTRGAVRYPAR